MTEPPERTWIEYGILGAEYIRKDVSDAKVEAAVKAEREACAKVATSHLIGDPMNGIALRNPMPHEIASAIRARGE